jgi:transcriptional regulator with XRE-family HTH domain
VTAVAGRSRGDGIDAHTAARLHELRMAAGLSERVLGELINVTWHQVHNYEAGANRITAARLYYITEALKVDTSILQAYREVWPALKRQLRYEDWFIKRELPPTAKPYRPEFHGDILPTPVFAAA